MQSFSINDWLGRLSLLASVAIYGDNSAMRGCFRPLAGRKAAGSLLEVMSSKHIQQVLDVLGPPCCVTTELQP